MAIMLKKLQLIEDFVEQKNTDIALSHIPLIVLLFVKNGKKTTFWHTFLV